MRILGLDPATRFGWAEYRDGAWRSGVWRLPEGAENFGPRLVAFLQVVDEFLAPGFADVDMVVVEDAGHFKSAAAARNHFALFGLVVVACEARGLPWISVAPSEAKKIATGKGNANKAAMLKAAEARWPGVEFASHDEADARLVLAAGASLLGWELEDKAEA